MAGISLTVKDTKAEVCGKNDKDTPVIFLSLKFCGLFPAEIFGFFDQNIRFGQNNAFCYRF